MFGAYGSTIYIVIACLAAIFVGVLEGNGAVYAFNHLPAKWLCDYGEEPSAELRDPYTQRVKSVPWKYIFSMLFVVLNIRLVLLDPQYALAATAALWLLLEMAIADRKYRIVPDQLIALLAGTGFGFFPYLSLKECALGAAVGFGFMGAIALLGKLAYKREALGGGDIKLFTALGLITGPSGVILIFLATALLSAGHMVFLLARRKIKRTDTLPMVPYIAVCAGLYLVFFWGAGAEILL